MKRQKIDFDLEILEDSQELDTKERELLLKAGEVARSAYAPYSHFLVGAAALLSNGEIITGVNVENASYPVGLCAERALLGTLYANYPSENICILALNYFTEKETASPLSPCGMCRQALVETEKKAGISMKILMGSAAGPVYRVRSASSLLPLAFTDKAMGI